MKFPDPPPKKDFSGLAISILAISGVLSLATMLIFLAAVVRSFIITKLWGWYLVPHFGVDQLPIVIAFGISLLVGYLSPIIHCEDKRKTSEKIAAAVVIPLFVLLAGWVGTLFI